MDLVSALYATEGIVCLVGAGGKKTTMYTLAARVERAVVTATVRIPIFDDHVAQVAVTDAPEAAIAASESWPIGVVPEREGEDRYRGYPPEIVDRLGDSAADAILVKADGARMRRFKAPGGHEPRIPARADTVIPVVSAHVIGQPLDEALVHRPERVAEVGGVAVGATITPELVADVIAHPKGGHKEVPVDATVVPLVNMVDDAEDRAAGRAIAAAVLDRVDVPHVVLAEMRSRDPLVEVIDE